MSDDAPVERRKAALLINIKARGAARAGATVSAALSEHGLALGRVVPVPRPEALGAEIDRLLTEGFDRLIVGGGDGTLGTVAARLAGRPAWLGVIPLGTANDFARTLGIPTDLAGAAAVAAGAHVTAVDLASANGETFLNVASIGLSVATTRMLSHRMKRWLGPAAYAVAGALAFVKHPTFRARIVTPAGSREALVHQVVAGNGRFYGGGVLVDKESTLDDGNLSVYSLGARGRWQLLRTMALLRLRVPLDRPGDVFLRTPEAFVETSPPGKRVNLDGELRTTTPVTFKVLPGALQVLTPAPPG